MSLRAGAVWRLVGEEGVNAAEGLAFDEALMRGYARTAPARPPTLRLYTYRDAALVGRYQHLDAEVNLDACARTGIDVNRRPTGGGAIVMGPGQLGVAVAMRAPTADRPKAVLEQLSSGIVAGLAEVGITASFRGKNDLEVGGRKIAGLGLYLDGDGAMLFHSSVLADLDVAFMLDVLRIPAAKLGDKAVAAVSERVTTVSREAGSSWTGCTLRDVIALGFAKALGVEVAEGAVEPAERQRMTELVASKFGTPEWLRERTPHTDATGTAVLKTPAGFVRLYLALAGDTIKSALFTGDFNEVPLGLARFEAALRWKRVDRAGLEALATANGSDEGLGVAASDLAAAVMEAAERAREHVAAPVRNDGSCYFPEETA